MLGTLYILYAAVHCSVQIEMYGSDSLQALKFVVMVIGYHKSSTASLPSLDACKVKVNYLLLHTDCDYNSCIMAPAVLTMMLHVPILGNELTHELHCIVYSA